MNSFKPGDWVIASKVCEKPKKFTTIAKLKKIKSVFTYAYPYILEDGNYCEAVELWQPKPNEWCWFWDKHTDIAQSPRLAQFHLIVEELQKPMDFPAFYQIKYKATKLGYLYDFCEPFIGQLPTSIKDQS